MKNRYFLLLDVPFLWVAALMAFVLRFDLRFTAYRDEFLFFIAVASVIKPLVFFASGVYGRYWRYASIPDALMLFIAITGASIAILLTLVAALWTDVVPSFSRSVVFNDWLLTVLLIGGLRGSVRLMAESQRYVGGGAERRSAVRKAVLIAGAGEAGMIVARDLRRNPQMGMGPVGFLDDDPSKIGHLIAGLRVHGRLSELGAIAAAHNVTLVVIAMPTAPGSVIRALSEQCRALSLESQIIPGVFELVGGRVTINRLRELQIADLLRRPHAKPSFNAETYVRDRTVLVSGAGGSIGAEICRQVAALGPARLIMLGHGENSVFEAHHDLQRDHPTLRLETVICDVRNRSRLQRLFTTLQPEIVFHAAAHKHVPLMEGNPEEAITNNAVGTRNMLQAALAAGVSRFVMISTDKAAVPRNVMGASKRLAEELVRQTARRFGCAFMVVRFGNVLASRGSAISIFQQQIKRGGPITITHPDMKRYFMTIAEASHLVLEAGAIGRGGELFVLRMGEPIPVVDLARDMIRLSGADDIPIGFTGVRPGEKMTELLWEEGAVTHATSHPDILAVHEEATDTIDWGAAIEHIALAAGTGDPQDILRELSRYLPTFSPVEERRGDRV
jgi:FlaA1/EpsC-like NDP-sugar epimerase